MAHTFFSIVIVSLNPGQKLAKTLRSVMEQEYGNFEVIIKDGGSTDGSLTRERDGSFSVAWPREWEKTAGHPAADSRVHVFSSPDKGIYDGMNQALPHINGDYVLFLNCGDCLYDLSVLARTAELIEKAEAGRDARLRARPFLFYGDQYNEKQKSVVCSAPKLTDFACYRNAPCHQVCFYDASLFWERGYDTDFRVRGDYEHFFYCLYERDAEPVHLPLIISTYEGGGFSETKENRKRSAMEHRVITRYYLGHTKAACYRAIMLATLAPLRTKIAENPALSKGYNAVKTAVYRRGRRREKKG
ncbi:MAG TPA: glycosyltransferase [Candidatus Eisenbergiella merdipullorum]|uniref:Glycosyltransferase n=1 Tax=Candidatus Eisenbergiella merdipullorum TaxID=2838553 RepID=A0A9D2L0N1_9FIRM|nr:glycosyltransferase [Candidatus Eisenbergiella merdipullorum]